MGSDDTWRIFVAVYPPPETVEALLRAARRLDLPPGRTTPREQVHLTVQFVGDTEQALMDDLLESVERSAAGLEPFLLRPLRLATLPTHARPRLIGALTDSPPALLEAQRRLAQRLAKNVRGRTGDRFTPHITLHRLRDQRGWPAQEAPLDLEAFRVDHMRVMRSALRREGATHEEVARVALAPRPRAEGPPV